MKSENEKKFDAIIEKRKESARQLCDYLQRMWPIGWYIATDESVHANPGMAHIHVDCWPEGSVHLPVHMRWTGAPTGGYNIVNLPNKEGIYNVLLEIREALEKIRLSDWNTPVPAKVPPLAEESSESKPVQASRRAHDDKLSQKIKDELLSVAKEVIDSRPLTRGSLAIANLLLAHVLWQREKAGWYAYVWLWHDNAVVNTYVRVTTDRELYSKEKQEAYMRILPEE